MIDAEFFDKLEVVARSLRRTPKPFGGIQLVITGDFFQLPPVDRGSSNSQFAFEASSWKSVIGHTIALHHVFRQRDEGTYNLSRVRTDELYSVHFNVK